MTVSTRAAASDARAVSRFAGLGLLDRIVGFTAGVYTVALISRQLGLEDFGKYSLAQTFVAPFALLADPGISGIAVREGAQRPLGAADALGAAYGLTIVSCVVSFLLCVATAIGLGYPADTLLAIAICSVVLLLSPLNVHLAVFQIELRNGFPVAASIASTLLCAGAVSVGAALGGGLVFMSATVVLATVLRYAISARFARRIRPLRPSVRPRVWWTLLGAAFPVASLLMLMTLINNFGIVVLSRLGKDADLGQFTAAWRLLVIAYSLPLAFSAAVFPLLSRYHRTDRERLQRLYQRSLDGMLIVAVPLATGATVLAPGIVELIFGAHFLDAVPVLQILIWEVVLAFLWIIQSSTLVAIDRQGTCLAVMAAITGLNLLAAYVAVVRAGALGLAVAQVSTYVLVLAAASVLLHRELGRFVTCSVAARVALASLGMALVVYALSGLPVLAAIAAGIATYAALGVLLRVVDPAEILALFGKTAVDPRRTSR